ncbi:hypothetical protein [Tessaracoccus antarcticus]|uniref:Uncharacterized protein n=1 Tax=Tessaracoccus antarcticus TaxID=2479848 RepID=A0A3M0G641_9ACTN|nr:hypothetical protein [Tessaracoccus antarcticus]RMB57263.1 hypothetical protein EAX62_16130 [Tessaracoccus antarcticus]
MTLDLNEQLSAPFCPKCADWHETTEDHSAISRDGVWESLVPLECMLCPAEGRSTDGTLPGWSLTQDMGGEPADVCPTCSAKIQ